MGRNPAQGGLPPRFVKLNPSLPAPLSRGPDARAAEPRRALSKRVPERRRPAVQPVGLIKI